MTDFFYLYMDDSGERQYSKDDKAGTRWFAMGGVVFKNSDKNSIEDKILTLKEKYSIKTPLHSYSIRNCIKGYEFLSRENTDEKIKTEFYQDLQNMLLLIPVTGISCVIHKKNHQLKFPIIKHEKERWQLCQTAFAITVERSLKYTINEKMKVRVESSGNPVDQKIQSYYSDLKNNGSYFSKDASQIYQPLDKKDFQNRLAGFKIKEKASPLMQIADLYLYPMAFNKFHNMDYNRDYSPYKSLFEGNKLIDCHISDEMRPILGIKYSSF